MIWSESPDRAMKGGVYFVCEFPHAISGHVCQVNILPPSQIHELRYFHVYVAEQGHLTVIDWIYLLSLPLKHESRACDENVAVT